MESPVAAAFGRLVATARSNLQATKPETKVQIQVGSATCENAAGSGEVWQEFQRHIEASGRSDILLRQTGCTGRCSCEPIVGVITPGTMPVKYQKIDRAAVHRIFTEHLQAGKVVKDLVLEAGVAGKRYACFFCHAERCGRLLSTNYRESFQAKLQAAGVGLETVGVASANCFGLCSAAEVGTVSNVMVLPDRVLYRIASEADLDDILRQHIQKGQVVGRLVEHREALTQRFFELYGDVAFFNQQSRLALRNCGIIDPESLDEYVQERGFEALALVLDRRDPAFPVGEITRSKLRGRGGGGYPTGLKWADAAKQPGPVKYIICNADEGDPGAFMDRSMLEGDPLSVIEGLIIGGYAVGAQRGFIYCRAEYPLAIKRLECGIAQARARGLLGKDILASGFDFDIEIRLGAGAFVCGEETALIHSIEGRRGQPRIRPPYPTVSGLWDKPTVINNVETLANVPVVLLYGADWFAKIGTEKSGGTKVFALAGKVKHTGLVEVPMGTTLKEIVFNIGGGSAKGRAIKAIQTGGPAGGCIPAKWFDTPVDFDTLTKAGTIMGSGGMIVMDEDDCMVDIAKFFLAFSADESCGKCTPCREGTTRMLEILERITAGQGCEEDLGKLERLGGLLRKASLCGLGRACANPVLSTLVHYRDEYLAHVRDKRCPARRCTALLRYEVVKEKCVGCTACARKCPVSCISGAARKPHLIAQERCIKCGACFQACKFDAIARS